MRDHSLKANASLVAAAVLGFAFTTAALAQGVQIPSPANPYPENPVATDGSSLLPGSGRTIRNVATAGGRYRDASGGFFAQVQDGN